MLSEFHSDVGRPELAWPSAQELLRAFTANQSEEAFGELTSRHLNWVYSAAVRQAGNHTMAQDANRATDLSYLGHGHFVAITNRLVEITRPADHYSRFFRLVTPRTD